MSDYITDEANLLARIDERLARIEDKLTRAEITFGAFLNGPGKKLMRFFGGAVKDYD